VRNLKTDEHDLQVSWRGLAVRTLHLTFDFPRLGKSRDSCIFLRAPKQQEAEATDGKNSHMPANA